MSRWIQFLNRELTLTLFRLCREAGKLLQDQYLDADKLLRKWSMP